MPGRLVADSSVELHARVAALEAVLVHDLDGRILEANEQAAAMLGYSVDELRRLDMFTIEESLRETGPALSRENWERTEPDVSMVARGRFLRKDGAAVPVELVVVARDVAGERHLLLVARDITDRLRVERALKDSEQRFRFLFEGAPVPMLRASGRGELQQVNQALCDWLRRAPRALVGAPARGLFAADDRRVFDVMWAALVDGPREPVRAELRVEAADGRAVWGHLTMFAEIDAAGRLKQVIGVLEDIDARKQAEAQVAALLATLEAQVEARTGELHSANQMLRREIAERERAEAQLIRAHERAESASRTKSRFLMVMSHELRTPLNAILGYTEMILDSLDAGVPVDDAEAHADLGRIRDAGDHLLGLIDDILYMSHVEAGGATLDLSRLDVAAFLRELGELTRAQLARSDLEFVVAAGDALGVIETDVVRLRQILHHLLRNAAKFTACGRITLAATRTRDGAGEWVVFEVQDTGIGIESEHIGRLFAPFVQVDDSPTRRHGGMGLGLALCRRHAEELGGAISVESVPGRGSLFCVRLPAAPPRRPL